MSSEDSTEVFRDNIQCDQDANVSRIETERIEEDDHQHDKDDEQHDKDKDYLQQHDEEPAYTPNVPVYNPYDALIRCTGCDSELEYVGKAGERGCVICGTHDEEEFLFCKKKCVNYICTICHENEMKL